MEKQDIIDYIRETPENTNSSVMLSMLNALPGGEDSILENAKETGGIGWTENEKEVIIPEMTLTSNNDGIIRFRTEANLYDLYTRYHETMNQLKLIINGKEYNAVLYQEYEYDTYTSVGCNMEGGYPFDIRQYDEDELGDVYVEYLQPNTTYTFELYALSETIHTLDQKYIDKEFEIVECYSVTDNEFECYYNGDRVNGYQLSQALHNKEFVCFCNGQLALVCRNGQSYNFISVYDFAPGYSSITVWIWDLKYGYLTSPIIKKNITLV